RRRRGANQLTSVGATSLSHDTRGNVTAVGGDTYAYSSENLLTSATVGGNAVTLAYDPLGRLYQVTGASGTRRFIYDGTDRVGDAETVGNWVANYVYGPGEDEPIVVHAQPAPVYLSSDERGSIISQSLDVTGAVVAINRYDEFGQPQSTNGGTFGYTGQAWIPDLKLWYYKARIYSPALGRFMQTDPI